MTDVLPALTVPKPLFDMPPMDDIIAAVRAKQYTEEEARDIIQQAIDYRDAVQQQLRVLEVKLHCLIEASVDLR